MTIQLNKEAKPNDKPRHKHADLIIAWANGAQIEFLQGIAWIEVAHPLWSVATEYRIKPEPTPDIERWGKLHQDGTGHTNALWWTIETESSNIKCTYDGETGQLKSVEML